jgi:hypothetical protein
MRIVHRFGVPALGLLCLACSGPVVVNTDDSSAAQAPSVTAAVTTTRPSNAHLANAFDFAAGVDGRTEYYFVSPSGRWECAIVPRTRATCRNAQTSGRLGIDGAPAEVPGPDGEDTAPNAVVLDRTADPMFAVLPPPGTAVEAGSAAELPFNRILAVAGFACNIQESTGISCKSELSGKGFTFSADGYMPRYTDVPADAP